MGDKMQFVAYIFNTEAKVKRLHYLLLRLLTQISGGQNRLHEAIVNDF